MAGEHGRAQRRRARRAARELLTPAEIGAELRAARQHAGLDLAEVHDRTGVSWRNLEALEAGEVGHFSDLSAAALAVSRYADVLELDPGRLVRSIQALRRDSEPGPPVTGPGPAGRGLAGTGHLSRFTGDQSHLRAFTQTAQVPSVGAGARLGFPLDTGIVAASGRDGQPHLVPPYQAIPAVAPGAGRRRRRAPLVLWLALWLVVVLLLVGTAGLLVNRYEPAWLVTLHLKHRSGGGGHGGHGHGGSTTGHGAVAGGHGGATSTTTGSTTAFGTSLVSVSHPGAGDAQVSVRAPTYTVVVRTVHQAWVSATVGSGLTPVIAQTLQPGQSVSIESVAGVVNLDVGSVDATITLRIDGAAVSGWRLVPDAVPYTATFQSVST